MTVSIVNIVSKNNFGENKTYQSVIIAITILLVLLISVQFKIQFDFLQTRFLSATSYLVPIASFQSLYKRQAASAAPKAACVGYKK